MSLENYSICILCDSFIEHLSEGWIGVDPCLTTSGLHMPTLEGEYSSHKFGNNLKAAILYQLSMENAETDSFGDADAFGYYELFEDQRAILVHNSNGSVGVLEYETISEARMAFGGFMDAYYDADEYVDELCYSCGYPADHSEASCQGEPLYDEYAYDPYEGAYESDLWDER